MSLQRNLDRRLGVKQPPSDWFWRRLPITRAHP